VCVCVGGDCRNLEVEVAPSRLSVLFTLQSVWVELA
jgi:hypothetical protein